LLRSLQEIHLLNGRRLWRRPRPNLGCGAKERERCTQKVSHTENWFSAIKYRTHEVLQHLFEMPSYVVKI
jgi:hypothetical protein